MTKINKFELLRNIKNERQKHILDAASQPLGRLAAAAAGLLRGKHKVNFDYHLDCGDFVEIINADKLILTGRKLEQKSYHHHTGYPGHLKTVTAKEMLSKDPTFIVRQAISGMLPKNKLRVKWLKRLNFK
ncbi:MAG: large subunit ribosomal protein L13 [Candidatus Berkelbacteria bacterium Licking1014_2]|uniref:Large ribosomal subunit protein uL13 n=1 Tax=Candidatus Berkelbacteria bacterium Licking1014_2 TaxID=2017146 RepID=A0A554LWJ8_9BACT|nr:MAG: large subunit ribosomal protein L13 [Candidatus Berkelbacteria bacterium Licking1014_2]